MHDEQRSTCLPVARYAQADNPDLVAWTGHRNQPRPIPSS
jgi:hypothetical protein